MTTSDHAPTEGLSALLDGQAPEWAGHVEGCASCGAELARLRAVRDAVGLPVIPVPPSVVDGAVARALREMAHPVGAGAGRPAPSVPPPAPRRGPDHTPVPLRRRSRAFVAAVASGSVAAVLLVVLAAFAVVGGGGSRTAVDTALAPSPERESATQDRAAAGAAADGAGAGVPGVPSANFVAGGDLGEVGDAAALAGRLSGRIPGTQGAPPPLAASAPAEVGGARSSTTVPVVWPCQQQARATEPGLGALVYSAVGTRQGRPVVVLGFRPGPAGPDAVSLLVLARDGCARLYATTAS